VDATIVLNFAALAISLVALVVSILLTVRQIRLASGGNHLPVVLDAFRHTRSAAWLDAENYVLTELTDEHAAGCGYRDLPAPARTHAGTIGLFYDDLGKLVAHGMIHQSLVIGSYGTNIVRLWDALAPYVYAERRARGLHFWIYFEDLAARTAATPPDRVYADLHLRSRSPLETSE
jgi:hypothetical protein